MSIRFSFVVVAAALAGCVASPGVPSCQASMSEIQVIGDRARTLARFEQLPEGCLKALLLRCSRDAGERLLDNGDAAMCSISYEALLRRGFDGNFDALLAWWRVHRDDPITD